MAAVRLTGQCDAAAGLDRRRRLTRSLGLAPSYLALTLLERSDQGLPPAVLMARTWNR